jgi:hypothetical protein
VTPEAAEADAIATTILRCPSGALQFRQDRRRPGRSAGRADHTQAYPPRTALRARGPGVARPRRRAGGARDTSRFCRCGLARQMPRCDNTCRVVGGARAGGRRRVGRHAVVINPRALSPARHVRRWPFGIGAVGPTHYAAHSRPYDAPASADPYHVHTAGTDA